MVRQVRSPVAQDGRYWNILKLLSWWAGCKLLQPSKVQQTCEKCSGKGSCHKMQNVREVEWKNAWDRFQLEFSTSVGNQGKTFGDHYLMTLTCEVLIHDLSCTLVSLRIQKSNVCQVLEVFVEKGSPNGHKITIHGKAGFVLSSWRRGDLRTFLE